MSISVRELISVLQAMEAKKAGPKKGRKKSRGGKSQATPGTSGAAVVTNLGAGGSKRKRKARRGGGNQLSQGEVVVSRSELLDTLTTGTDGKASASKVLVPVNLPWLSNVAKAFERCRWQSVRIEYRPAVGANTDGTVAVGFDWGSSNEAKEGDGGAWTLVRAIDRVGVLACTPNVDGPVWSKASLTIPSQRLQSRAWYEVPAAAPTSDVYDFAPGSLVYYVQGAASKTLGEIWVHYRVQLSGTRKV